MGPTRSISVEERFRLIQMAGGKFWIEHDRLDFDTLGWVGVDRYGPFPDRQAARQFMLDRKAVDS